MSSAARSSTSVRSSSGTPHVSSASTSRVRGEDRHELRPPPGQDVDDAARDVGRGEHLGQRHGRQRPALAGDEDDRVAGDERRREAADEARAATTSPGATTPTTPVGSGIVKLKYGAATGLDEPEHLGDLVGPAGVPDPAVDGAVDDGAGGGGPEPLGRLDLGDELVAAALHQLGDAVEDLAAVHRGLGGPAVERLARGADRVAEVLARRPAGVGERRPVGRRDEVRAARFGAREGPADVQLVGLADLDPGGRGGGGRRLGTGGDRARRSVPPGRGWSRAAAARRHQRSSSRT